MQITQSWAGPWIVLPTAAVCYKIALLPATAKIVHSNQNRKYYCQQTPEDRVVLKK
jgi:hypothetical protein